MVSFIFVVFDYLIESDRQVGYLLVCLNYF